MTARNIMERIPGSHFEHTGGNVYTVYSGSFAIGPFERFGEPAESTVSVLDERTDAITACETLGEVVAATRGGA